MNACKRCNGNGAVSCDGTALPPDCDDRELINICVRCDGSGEQEPRCSSRNLYGRVCERPAGHDAGHRATGRGACVWYDPAPASPSDQRDES